MTMEPSPLIKRPHAAKVKYPKNTKVEERDKDYAAPSGSKCIYQEYLVKLLDIHSLIYQNNPICKYRM